MDRFCRAYWYPLYAYVRRRGFAAQDAEDLTQDFFHHLLASDWVSRADPSKGRFRTFLLCGIQNFLANEWQRGQRIKRGGGRPAVPLDALSAEQRYLIEPKEIATADKLFDRRWALTLVERALERLESELSATETSNRFTALREVLLGEPSDKGYAALALQFKVSESTVKSWVRRFRLRYREILREEVQQTVSNLDDTEDELRYLMRVLTS
jgi:RNA polymerase sigma-70 factor (ECF subfamily)